MTYLAIRYPWQLILLSLTLDAQIVFFCCFNVIQVRLRFADNMTEMYLTSQVALDIVPPDEILDLYGYLPLVQTLRNASPDVPAAAATEGVRGAAAPPKAAEPPVATGSQNFESVLEKTLTLGRYGFFFSSPFFL